MPRNFHLITMKQVDIDNLIGRGIDPYEVDGAMEPPLDDEL